jgi:hypothetical protein
MAEYCGAGLQPQFNKYVAQGAGVHGSYGYPQNMYETLPSQVPSAPPLGLQESKKTYGKMAELEVDPVRRNIYNGGTICGFKPRDDINTNMCDRMFLNAPQPPPWQYANTTDTEFYLRHGESSACSAFWRFRYNKKPNMMGDSGKYERVGPASLDQR